MEDNLIIKQLFSTVKSVDEKNYTIDFIFSTPDTDRHGEEIDQKGWKLDEFMKNPVVLFAHDQWQPAVGQVIKIGFVDGNLEGTVKFAAEENPFAKILFDLYKNGFMRAVSVGFANTEYKYNEETERLVLLENILYELSLVNVPANARALAKQKGIDLSALENKEKELAKQKEEAHVVNEVVDRAVDKITLKLDKVLSNDKAGVKNKKVETPTGKGVKGFATKKQVNKAIRLLLKEKQKFN